jgi:hypothetical protein
MLLVQWYHKGLRVAGMQCIRLGRGGAMGGTLGVAVVEWAQGRPCSPMVSQGPGCGGVALQHFLAIQHPF